MIEVVTLGDDVAGLPSGGIGIGVAREPVGPGWDRLGESLALTLVAGRETAAWQVAVPDPDSALDTLQAAVGLAPVAARTLLGVLAATSAGTVRDGLVAESSAYSMLMSGAEYQRWRERRSRRANPEPSDPAVLLERDGNALTVTLNRPERHNAFSRHVRDGLVEAFDLVAADDTIDSVTVRGAGPSFCSGGDLDEFGTSSDLAVAHLIRLDRSVAARIDAVRSRVRFQLHGACIGAGIELASFAGAVVAAPSAAIRLPELAMGLIPGAGGTVGITRRIGRWRTAWMALTGEQLALETARRWGLVDVVAP